MACMAFELSLQGGMLCLTPKQPFSSLLALIEFYRANSLVEHFRGMNTTLAVPCGDRRTYQ